MSVPKESNKPGSLARMFKRNGSAEEPSAKRLVDPNETGDDLLPDSLKKALKKDTNRRRTKSNTSQSKFPTNITREHWNKIAKQRETSQLPIAVLIPDKGLVVISSLFFEARPQIRAGEKLTYICPLFQADHYAQGLRLNKLYEVVKVPVPDKEYGLYPFPDQQSSQSTGSKPPKPTKPGASDKRDSFSKVESVVDPGLVAAILQSNLIHSPKLNRRNLSITTPPPPPPE